MKERPILFNDAMTRAILAGTKTQTRRVLGLPSLRPSTTPGHDWTWRGQAPIRSVAQQARHPRGCWQDVSHAELLDLCPYGAPGDRMWVRETWAPVDRLRTRDPGTDALCRGAFYRADYQTGIWDDAAEGGAPLRWTPSTHMPRSKSRLSLEITSVRVERVQSIDEDDARAEGVEPLLVPPDGGSRPHVEGFASLWDSINGEREGCSWAANPWVWVVGFKRLEVRRG